MDRSPRPRPHDSTAVRLAALAALLADETRASFCLALLDGRAWTAGELARYAGAAPSTASEHLGRLVLGGLLAEERQGRHRYVRLAGERAAHLVEELASRTMSGEPEPPRSLRACAGGGVVRAGGVGAGGAGDFGGGDSAVGRAGRRPRIAPRLTPACHSSPSGV